MTTRAGLAIDETTNDVYLDADGNLVMAHDTIAVGQHVRQRLKHFKGEWPLDMTAGVPWFEDIFGAQFDAALAEAMIKVEILNTEGVSEIESFSVTFDPTTRAISGTRISVLTVYDEGVTV